MTRFTIFAFGLLLLSCTIKNKSNDVEFTETPKPIEHTITRLDRIKVWRDSSRMIALPFRANFDSSIVEKFRLQFGAEDSLFRGEFDRGDIYVIGFLADTTNFYTVAYMSVAAFAIPGIITFDKKGNKVDGEMLSGDNCVIYSGDVLLCKEYTTIGKDLSLEYYLKSIVAGEGDSMDTVCVYKISKGRINKNGEIDLGQVTEVDCQEEVK